MIYWVREIAGWVLIALGLYVFWITIAVILTDRPWYISAVFLTIIGVVVFRAGLHLLKVSVAARICLHAQGKAEEGDGRERRPGRGQR